MGRLEDVWYGKLEKYMFDMPLKGHKIVPDNFESLLVTPDCDNDATKNLLTLFNANTESIAQSCESESGKLYTLKIYN